MTFQQHYSFYHDSDQVFSHRTAVLEYTLLCLRPSTVPCGPELGLMWTFSLWSVNIVRRCLISQQCSWLCLLRVPCIQTVHLVFLSVDHWYIFPSCSTEEDPLWRRWDPEGSWWGLHHSQSDGNFTGLFRSDYRAPSVITLRFTCDWYTICCNSTLFKLSLTYWKARRAETQSQDTTISRDKIITQNISFNTPSE